MIIPPISFWATSHSILPSFSPYAAFSIFHEAHIGLSSLPMCHWTKLQQQWWLGRRIREIVVLVQSGALSWSWSRFRFRVSPFVFFPSPSIDAAFDIDLDTFPEPDPITDTYTAPKCAPNPDPGPFLPHCQPHRWLLSTSKWKRERQGLVLGFCGFQKCGLTILLPRICLPVLL